MGQSSGQGGNPYGGAQPMAGNSMPGFSGGATPGYDAYSQRAQARPYSGGAGAMPTGGMGMPDQGAWRPPAYMMESPFMRAQQKPGGLGAGALGGGGMGMPDQAMGGAMTGGGDPTDQNLMKQPIDAILGGGAMGGAPATGGMDPVDVVKAATQPGAMGGAMTGGADPVAGANLPGNGLDKAATMQNGGVPPWDAQRLGMNTDNRGWGRRMRGNPWGYGGRRY